MDGLPQRTTLGPAMRPAIAPAMKRAVIGEPS